MKKCEDYKGMFLDGDEGTADASARAELQQHLDSCASCRQEVAAMQAIWNELGDIKVPEPSDEMALKFKVMLNDFKQRDGKSSPWADWAERARQFWLFQYRIPFAYTVLMMILCIGAALWLKRDSSEKQQLQALQTQVHELKQTMMLAMLDNPLASERIKAVSYTTNIRHPDGKVVRALLETLNNDPNVNVRLTTLDALSQLGGYSEVRSGLIRSINAQDSPLMQSAIADVMLMLREKRAVRSFRELLKQKNLDEDVREKIKITITKLI